MTYAPFALDVDDDMDYRRTWVPASEVAIGDRLTHMDAFVWDVQHFHSDYPIAVIIDGQIQDAGHVHSHIVVIFYAPHIDGGDPVDEPHDIYQADQPCWLTHRGN